MPLYTVEGVQMQRHLVDYEIEAKSRKEAVKLAFEGEGTEVFWMDSSEQQTSAENIELEGWSVVKVNGNEVDDDTGYKLAAKLAAKAKPPYKAFVRKLAASLVDLSGKACPHCGSVSVVHGAGAIYDDGGWDEFDCLPCHRRFRVHYATKQTDIEAEPFREGHLVPINYHASTPKIDDPLPTSTARAFELAGIEIPAEDEQVSQ
mgnify:FL=1